jgi:four helix bundle protein
MRDLTSRLKKFAVRILRIADALPNTAGARAAGQHLANSGISVLQNYVESQAASSKKHFISYIEIAEREARETLVTLEVIDERGYFKAGSLNNDLKEANEIVAILVTIGKKAKEKPDICKR